MGQAFPRLKYVWQTTFNVRMPQTSSSAPTSPTADMNQLSLSTTVETNATHPTPQPPPKVASKPLSKTPLSGKLAIYASSKVLVQHGVTLTQLDRDSMNDHGWYTDTVIAYSQAHIAITIPYFFLASIVMMRPSEVSLISSVATENIEVLLQVVDDNPVRKEIKAADYIIVPINSLQQGIAGMEAGVHWSILMLDRKTKKVNGTTLKKIYADFRSPKALHYDSKLIQEPKQVTKTRLNEQHAIAWLNRFESVFDALPWNSKSEATARYLLKCRFDTPQDISGSGCGPIACWITKMLIMDI
jgi:hypothetical protein